MPIIDIEIVEDRDESGPGDTRVHTLADALGEVFGSDPGRTWVRVYHLPREHYAENGGEVPADVRPVFVSVLKAMLPGEEELAGEAERVAGAVAGVLGRPVDNVHVLYEPEAAGKIAFGGKLRRRS